MAGEPTLKTTTILEITLEESSGDETVLRIDNPRDDLIQASLTSAFSPVLDSGYWVSSRGNPITAITGSQIITTTVVTEEVPETQD